MAEIVIASLDIGTRPTGAGPAVLTLRGSLDAASADEVAAAVRGLASGGARSLVIDLTELRFIDSSGLAALLEADQLVPDGASLVGSRGVVRRVLQVAALEPPLRQGDEATRAIAGSIVDDAAPRP